MSFDQLDFPYVQTFLKNVGVRIKKEPGEYFVMRGSGWGPGPLGERRGIDSLRDAFVYGLQLALLPPPYQSPLRRRIPKHGHNARAYEIRKQQAEARRHEIEEERAVAAARRKAMIRAELAKLGLPA